MISNLEPGASVSRKRSKTGSPKTRKGNEANLNLPRFRLADFFCGAGGTSTGASEAMRQMGLVPEITAVNHWPPAINTHKVNHMDARHYCTGVDELKPSVLYPDGRLNALWASPSCRMHSQANSGEMDQQDRASAHCVTRWAEALYPETILVENVPQFRHWGPLDPKTKRPIKEKRGETFNAWLNMFRSMGYKVDYRILNCADYGDPTTRQRIFIQCVRGPGRKITWPEPTHSKPGTETNLFGTLSTWIPAETIIDLSDKGTSIFGRKTPLKPNTLKRIEGGLNKQGFAPFLVTLRGTSKEQVLMSNRPLSLPLPTITAGGIHAGICHPRILNMDGSPLPLDKLDPFLISYYGNGTALSIKDPLDTITTHDRFGLATPIIKVEGQKCTLDILYRMLRPHELALGQGFLPDYKFTGKNREILKQIGNAVPRRTARAVFGAAVSGNPFIHHDWIDDPADMNTKVEAA